MKRFLQIVCVLALACVISIVPLSGVAYAAPGAVSGAFDVLKGAATQAARAPVEVVSLTRAQLQMVAQELAQLQAAQLREVALEAAAATRALYARNRTEETRAFTLSTATSALTPASGLSYQAYQCTTTASTSATGVYVVTAGTATGTITNGYGPFCSDTSQCPLGGTIVGDSGAVSVQAASGTPALRCRFGLP